MNLAIDIGTHKIVALVYRQAEQGIEVVASSYRRHPARSMRDGQIHDVAAVSRLLREMNEELQSAVGVKLEAAHVAAAGRSLKTAWGRADELHAEPILYSESERRLLEWRAVADAQSNLLQTMQKSEKERGYYCVARSIVAEWLDDDRIGSLVGQRGKHFSMDVLATFLPGAVVDSLETALRSAGLAMAGLTLEPIAALEAIVPPTMRHLNLVLVDIGAGTTDIAIIDDGTVCAYDMVPSAGDSMTEALSKAYLLDFQEAEQVKRSVTATNYVEAVNVLGQTVIVHSEDVQRIVEEPVRHLAARIAASIREWNGKQPDAILLVGGGSLTPGLPLALADMVGLSVDRVAVRDRSAIRNVYGADELSGPDAVTPLGIVIRSLHGNEMAPVRVRVNGKPVSLFQSERCTVVEALRAAGLPPEQITGRLGRGITVTVNGDFVAVPGYRGEAARVWVDGVQAELDTVLQNQAEVKVEPPQEAPERTVRVRDVLERWRNRLGNDSAKLLGEDALRIRVDGEWYALPRQLVRNGERTELDDVVSDRDVLTFQEHYTLAEALAYLRDTRELASVARAYDAGSIDDQHVRVCTVNGHTLSLPTTETLWFRGGERLLPDSVLYDGDELVSEQQLPWTVADLLRKNAGAPWLPQTTFRVTVNGKEVEIRSPLEIRINGKQVEEGTTLRPGDRVEIHSAWEQRQPTLHELLPYVRWNDTDGFVPSDDGSGTWNLARGGEGKKLILRVGGQPAGFTTPIQEGDDVIVQWGPAAPTNARS